MRKGSLSRHKDTPMISHTAIGAQNKENSNVLANSRQIS